MFLQPIYNNQKLVMHDSINKLCLKNCYNLTYSKQLSIILPKALTSKIKELSSKKAEFLLKILVLHYFLLSATPYVCYYPPRHKIKSRITFKLSLSTKKANVLQIANFRDISFSKTYFYSYAFIVLLEYIFLDFFLYKKKNIFIFKLIKI